MATDLARLLKRGATTGQEGFIPNLSWFKGSPENLRLMLPTLKSGESDGNKSGLNNTPVFV